MKVYKQGINSGYLVSATPYTISSLSLCNFAHLFFFHGLKMCMWFGFNPAVNFYHFSTLLTLSFFAGVTSTSLKFDLYFVLLFAGVTSASPKFDLYFIFKLPKRTSNKFTTTIIIILK